MTKDKIFLYTFCAYVIFITCSVVTHALPRLVLTFFPAIMLGVAIITDPRKVFSNKAFLFALLYIFMLAAILFDHKVGGFGYGKGGWDTFSVDVGFTLPSIACASLLVSDRNKRDFRIINWVLIACVVISLLYMLPVALYNRAFIRYLAVHYREGVGIDSNVASFVDGFWNYIMLHIIALAFPVFWGLTEYAKGKMKYVYMAMTVCVLYLVAISSIMTTIIFVLGALMYLAYHKWKKYRVAGILLFAGLIILLILNIETVLDYMLEYFRGTDAEKKILDFQDIVRGGENRHATIDGRTAHHDIALQAFYDSPLWGREYYGGGGHSYLLNRMGSGGLFLTIPYVAMLWCLYKQWLVRIPKEFKVYFNVSWIGAVILLYNKGCFGLEGYLFMGCLIPSLCMSYSLLRKKSPAKPPKSMKPQTDATPPTGASLNP